jgi:hypothetical protein
MIRRHLNAGIAICVNVRHVVDSITLRTFVPGETAHICIIKQAGVVSEHCEQNQRKQKNSCPDGNYMPILQTVLNSLNFGR